jgi:hypothetical protein
LALWRLRRRRVHSPSPRSHQPRLGMASGQRLLTRARTCVRIASFAQLTAPRHRRCRPSRASTAGVLEIVDRKSATGSKIGVGRNA